MSLLLLPLPPAPPFDAPLDLLEEVAGWRHPVPPPCDFAAFRLIALPSRKGWPVALCEAAVGSRMPDYAERRSWRELLPGALGSGILIHTDAAHSSFVWSWRQGQGEYVEHRLPGREATLHLGLRELPAFGAAATRLAGHPVVLERLLDFLAPIQVRQGAADDPAAALRDWIERMSSPPELRSRWRALRRFAVLDRECRSAEHLLAGARALEVVYLALLERMRSLVDDAGDARERRRPEHLRDLRRIVEETEHLKWGQDRRRFARRTIIQQNLFAIAHDRASARRCLNELLQYTGLSGEGVPILDCNVWHRRSDPRRPMVQSGGDTAGSPGISRAEEVEIVQKAWAAARRMRIEGGDREDFVRSGRQLEARRSLLRRQLEEVRLDESTHFIDGWPPDELAFCRGQVEGARFTAVVGGGGR